MSPFTDWATVPLVCDRETTARVLNTSVRSIDRRLQLGTMQPAPMPRMGRRVLWSKAILQQFVDGGYQKVAVRRRG